MLVLGSGIDDSQYHREIIRRIVLQFGLEKFVDEGLSGNTPEEVAGKVRYLAKSHEIKVVTTEENRWPRGLIEGLVVVFINRVLGDKKIAPSLIKNLWDTGLFFEFNA